MPFVSVTRLRLRSLRFLVPFVVATIRSLRQLREATGFREGAVLRDRGGAFWTATLWDDEAAMRTYVLAGPHRLVMRRLATWCDEAGIVHWDAVALPSFGEAHARLCRNGRSSPVRHPSPDQAARRFPPPGGGLSRRVRPASRP